MLSILYGPALSLWSKLGLTVGSVLVWRPYIKADWLKKISVCHFQHLLREAWGLILSLWTGFLLETLNVKTHLPILHLGVHLPPSQANIRLRSLSSQISLGLPHWRHILYHLGHQGSHLNLQPWSMWPSLLIRIDDITGGSQWKINTQEGESGMNLECSIDIYKLQYVKQMPSGKLL